jgi:hypothetical protein
VVKLVDALDSKSSELLARGGSSPPSGTREKAFLIFSPAHQSVFVGSGHLLQLAIKEIFFGQL